MDSECGVKMVFVQIRSSRLQRKRLAGGWSVWNQPWCTGQLQDGLAISMINSDIFHRFSPAALHKLKLQNRDQNSLAKQKPLLKISKQTLSGLTQKLFPSTIALESFRGQFQSALKCRGFESSDVIISFHLKPVLVEPCWAFRWSFPFPYAVLTAGCQGGGYQEATLSVQGAGAWTKFKFESGWSLIFSPWPQNSPDTKSACPWHVPGKLINLNIVVMFWSDGLVGIWWGCNESRYSKFKFERFKRSKKSWELSQLKRCINMKKNYFVQRIRLTKSLGSFREAGYGKILQWNTRLWGVHRVQRVPSTEKASRARSLSWEASCIGFEWWNDDVGTEVHTSTATVAIMPEVCSFCNSCVAAKNWSN